MKSKRTIIKRTIIMMALVLAILISLLAPRSARAAAGGCQESPEGPPIITLEPNAPGTKYFGTLTLYYVDFGATKTKMYYFIRIGKNNDQRGFSGYTDDIAPDGYTDQQAAIKTFLETVVVPDFTLTACDDCFKVKSVTDWVTVKAGAPPVVFWTLDFVLGVQE
jgi:hypothetical protein